MSTDVTTSDSTGSPIADPDGDGRPGMLERPVSRVLRPHASGVRLRGRPDLYTGYAQDMALLNTPAKRWSVIAIIVLAYLGSFTSDATVTLLAGGFALAIGALGLNIITGYAGQVSLGHGFFIGIGAYTATVLSSPKGGSLLGFGITFLPIWLVASGVMAAVAGLVVAPIAMRLKGLYLGIVTLGLVFLGEHLYKELRPITGGPGVGRRAAVPELFGEPLNTPGDFLGISMSGPQRIYAVILTVLIIAAVVARNIARSDLGRAMSAVRDRDIAAEVIGVDIARTKVLAFLIGSFYAGVAGSLAFTVSGFVLPESFNLLLSIRFIAAILIGGVSTVSGAIMGAMFVALLPRIANELAGVLPSAISLSSDLLESLLYGVLIVSFLILEPRGLFGLWLRVRNYWKAWPFSY